LRQIPDDFVFATRNRTAINQRNVLKALRAAMKSATHDDGCPVFPILHERDDTGRPVKVPRNAVPCFHSFRHTAASQAFADGERVEEVAWLLRHASANTTRSVYLHEIRDAEAKAQRRSRMAARMAAWSGSEPQQAADALERESADLQEVRDTPQQAQSAQVESLKDVRAREKQMAEHAERAYRQLVADWQAKAPRQPVAYPRPRRRVAEEL
jgi:hypothetical protein